VETSRGKRGRKVSLALPLKTLGAGRAEKGVEKNKVATPIPAEGEGD